MENGIPLEQALEGGSPVNEDVSAAEESGSERSKLASWLVIASSWVFTLLIIILGFSLVGILESVSYTHLTLPTILLV